MRSRRGWPLLLLALLAISCAGPAQLARMSERELRAGNLRKAYELARRGVDKDPASEAARRAMAAAATQLVDDWKGRILGIAGADTVAAARYGLELRDFRAELSRYRIEVPPDPGFAEREERIRDGAAGIEYRRGVEALAARRPKEAWADFLACAEFVAAYRDVQEWIRTAHDQAITRVAILPFANETDVPNLSKSLADAIYGQVAHRLDRHDFEFTELVDPDEVYASMTVKELESLPRDGAFRIGSGVEADRIVVGRFHGMRASSTFQSFDHSIYHKVVERDTSGKTHEHYMETRFVAISRERVVAVHYDLEVLDTRTRAVIASRSEPLEAVARVLWTDFRADGDCDDYCLVPPDLKKSDPERAGVVETRWKECCGEWKLPDLLEHARNERRRAHYQSSYRGEFARDTRGHPVLLGELPSEEDLAYLALGETWRPVLATLRELDKKD